MKIKMDRGKTIEAKRIRIETDDFIFDLNIDKITGNLVINKVDGKHSGNIRMLPRYSNQVEMK